MFEHKTDKELAIEAAIEFVKSWNASDRTQPINIEQFTNAIQSIYDTISSLD